MTDNIGVMMFVESSRPPSPTSMTATSTCSSAKYLNAIAVVSSKKEGGFVKCEVWSVECGV